jgi:cation diffusion facilitator CzcD-associated flavoprotein CzcO
VSYQFSWEPAIWSQYYSEAREIFAYFKGIVDKYDLWKYMHLNHRVDKVVWSSEGHWTVTVTDLVEGRVIEEECDVFLNACGPLK